MSPRGAETDGHTTQGTDIQGRKVMSLHETRAPKEVQACFKAYTYFEDSREDMDHSSSPEVGMEFDRVKNQRYQNLPAEVVVDAEVEVPEPTCGGRGGYWGKGQTLIQGPGIKWFEENSAFEIICSYSLSSTPISADQLRFYDEYGNKLSKDKGFIRTVLSSSKTSVNVSLSKDKIQKNDIGRYYCRYDENNLDFYVHVAVVQVQTTPQTYNLSMVNQPNYTLSCDFTAVVDNETRGMIRSKEVLWYKDGIAAGQISSRHLVKGSTLTIKNAVWSDIGLYNCDYRVGWGTDSTTVIQNTVAFKGMPRIGSLGSSINLIQDEPLILACPVSGYPYPVVTWQLNGVNITPDSRRTVSTDADGKYNNSVLNVNSVQFEDRGEYTCTGRSELDTVTSSSVLVRVKDKYAAVWPFIGIVLEFIVLAIIIFICEKKKRGLEAENKEGATEPEEQEVRQPDEQKESDLRQRNVPS